MNNLKLVTLEERKQIELNILKQVDEFCAKNKITYFLGGGTLLGAIRHKGFIPWDDDIDIMLPRKDYEKFMATYQHDFYKLISYKTNPDYCQVFSKVVDTRTKLVEEDVKNIDEMGIYIDIFPIDKLPDDMDEIKKVFQKYQKLSRKLNLVRVSDFKKHGTNKLKMIVKMILAKLVKNVKPEKYLKQMDEICMQYKDKDTSFVACICGRYAEKEVMPKGFIEDSVEVEFEGMKCKAPFGYEEYLIKHYGDYMKLPPVEKQNTNHTDKAYWRK